MNAINLVRETNKASIYVLTKRIISSGVFSSTILCGRRDKLKNKYYENRGRKDDGKHKEQNFCQARRKEHS